MLFTLGLVTVLMTTVVRSANVIERVSSVQDGAVCDDRIPAYLVADGQKIVGAENKIIYKDVEEQECKNMCTDNKDESGTQVLCSSYVYNIKEKSCSVFRGKAMPAGKLELKAAPGHRYYEKFCLPEGTPADCGEAPFFRADQAVLIGFAKNVSHTKSLTTCIQACIEMSAECRSAMFFGAAGECILSVASAQDAPDVFADEEDEEKVVYFENGCVMDNQIRSQKKQNAKQKAVDAKKLAPTAKVATNSTSSKPAAPANGTKPEDVKKPKNMKSSEDDKRASSSETTTEEGAGEGSQEKSRKTPAPRQRVTLGGGKSAGKGEKRKLLQGASDNGVEESAWGSWGEECRSFDERRPCTNGNRVGFQSRQCLRTPFECQGPFFRYCIASC
jgi:hypothetical protein